VDIVKRSRSRRVLNMKIETDRAVINIDKIDKDEIPKVFDAPISTLFYLDPVYNRDRTLQGYIATSAVRKDFGEKEWLGDQ